MNQKNKDDTSRAIDGILRFVAGGGFLTLSMLIPNSAGIIDKSLTKVLDKLDVRAKDRELRRVAYYMKQKGLIQYGPDDYEHGMTITKDGIKRLESNNYKTLKIPIPKRWDRKWRLIFFDIPIIDNDKRHSFTAKLRRLGFQQLQKSIWAYPFECREQIELVAEKLNIRRYVTYIEITDIDSEPKLRARFKKLLSETKVH